MDREDVLARTRQHVQEVLGEESTGHDWWHIERVCTTALAIARGEGADPFGVGLAALLHDIADWKFHDGDASVGPQRARAWLEGLGVEGGIVDEVCETIACVSFKGAGVETPVPTLAGRIVQDADRLDALGAIGIARTFAYGGHKGQPLHDPRMEPQQHATFAEYQQKRTTSINHFHEKLLLLKDRMNTETGRALAAGRHAFMEAFLEQFADECAGRK
ncbi:MAG: HD domain-containing protein [Planctomycetota bacterium]|nr:MAG: HD domain-containing protein [Planctomycetota bacterium]